MSSYIYIFSEQPVKVNNKSALIIPAWQQKSTEAAYTNVAAVLKYAGYEVRHQPIAWKSRTMSQWAQSIAATIHQTNGPASICAFGLGAMAALVAATQVPVENLILCSPSGYFKEYLGTTPVKEQQWMGDARKAELGQLSWQTVLGAIQVKHGYIIVDQGEFAGRPAYKQWIEDLAEVTGWRAIKVSHEPYGISSPGYQKAVITVIREFL